MVNEWHKIWNNRSENFSSVSDNVSNIFMEMIRIDGGDITDEVTFDSYFSNYEGMKEKMNVQGGDSLFEVGCGCGPYLYLLNRDGYNVGGMDYSATLLKHMDHVLPESVLVEKINNEALLLPTEVKYDIVFSRGVFHYFPDLDYAYSVLEKMLDKAKKTIGIFMIHDKNKEHEFVEGRKKIDPNYEEKYKNLPKLFFTKEYFKKFADTHGVSVEFTQVPLKGFWNDEYTFDCVIRKD